jgi:hypothetical protein
MEVEELKSQKTTIEYKNPLWVEILNQLYEKSKMKEENAIKQ